MSEGDRTLRIDFRKCVKAGECYYNHPDLFASTAGGDPALKVGRLDTALLVREAGEAIEVCPSGAISIS